MILCCGEALIDMLPVPVPGPGPDARSAPAWSAHSGGAVYNTSVALGRLGTPVGLMTGLSRDGFGDLLRRGLTEAGVSQELCEQTDRKTALAFVSLSDGQARYSFHDVGSAHRMFQPAADLRLPDHVEALFCGGISLASEPCGAAMEAFILGQTPDRCVMLDPNIRPSFIEDEPTYRARLRRLIQRADIVKLSDEDGAWLAPSAGSLSEQMDHILAQGPSLVLMTEGAKGAHLVSRAGHRISVPAPVVSVVDTVGAGDTFNAGVLARLHAHGLLNAAELASCTERDLRDAVAHGIAAAAFVVGRAGANAPWKDELRRA